MKQREKVSKHEKKGFCDFLNQFENACNQIKCFIETIWMLLLRGDLKLNKVVVAVTCETGGGGERKTSSLIITVAYTSVPFQLDGGMLPQKV